MVLQNMINVLMKTYDFTKRINLLMKSHDSYENDKIANKRRKGVIL